MKPKSILLLFIIGFLALTVSAQKKKKTWLRKQTEQVKKIFSKKNSQTQPVHKPAPHKTEQPHVF